MRPLFYTLLLLSSAFAGFVLCLNTVDVQMCEEVTALTVTNGTAMYNDARPFDYFQ
jgi:hypothetical protein